MKLGSLKKYLPFGTLGVSLIFHLAIFLSISGIILIQATAPKQPFQPGTGAGITPSDLPPPPEPEDNPSTPEPIPQDNHNDSHAAMTSVPVEQIASNATTNATFTLPPQIAVLPGATQGLGGGRPSSDGAKSNNNSGPPRTINPFGDTSISGGGALIGTMYDLKQTADRKPSKMTPDSANGDYQEFVKRFVNSGWNDELLKPFYKVERPIGTYQIFIPGILADKAPAAFNAEKYVQPRRWLILYTGSFTSPVSGTYRFIGMGDDILVVRLSKRNVLDGCLIPVFGDRRESLGQPYTGAYKHYQMYAGSWFNLEAGQTYSMDVLIGERPGGQFAAYLLIQEKGVDYPKIEKDLSPPLPVFQTKAGSVPKGLAPHVTPNPFLTKQL
jgi:hypothetical protein